MKSLYYIKHKGRIALLLISLIILELLSNDTYNRSITRLGTSITEVYSDRLIAQDYIYKISNELHRQKYTLANHSEDANKSIAYPESSLEIKNLLSLYETTKFTDEEKIIYSSFKKDILTLKSLEKEIAKQNDVEITNRMLLKYESLIDKTLAKLNELSAIQINMGKNINDDSQKIVSFSSIINQFDWALILTIALIILALVFTAKSTQPKVPQVFNMN